MSKAPFTNRRLLAVGALLLLVLVGWWWAGGDSSKGQGSSDSAPTAVKKAEPTRAAPPAPLRARGDVPQTPSALSPAEPWEGRVREDGTLPNGRFEGIVVNHGSGEPVPNAELVFSFLGAAESVHSDEAGRFLFTPSKTGGYQLAMASAEGFLPYAPEWEASPISLVARPGLIVSGLRVTLVPRIDYQGLVVDEDDEPVAGARVVIRPGPEDSLSGQTQFYTSDAEGRFVFHARDNALVIAEERGRGRGSARVDSAVQISRTLTVELGNEAPEHGGEIGELEGSARIDGVVVDEEGEAIPSFHLAVEARSGLQLLGLRQRAVVDGAGRFSLVDLPEGDVEIGVAAAGYAPGRARGTATSASSEPLRIVLRRGSAVHGVVRDADSGEPLEWAKVSLEGQLSSGSSARPVLISDVCDSDGRFELRGLPPGRHSLFAAAADHNSQLVQVELPESSGRVGPIEVSLSPVAEGERPKLELAGIGAALEAVERGMKVTRIFPNSGAALAGLQVEDIILEVDGSSTLELGFQGSIQRIRGPVGSTVRLTIARADTVLALDVQRVKLKV